MAVKLGRTSQRLLESTLSHADGPLTLSGAREALGVSTRTAQRALHGLVASGELERVGRGYSSRLDVRSLDSAARQILASIRATEADAHLTGFDVLAGYAHQFAYEYPHLVYCHPSHVDECAAALATRGFLVSSAGPRAFIGPNPSKSVLLRSQPHAEGRYPIRDSIAAPEKAWVDLLREIRRSKMPFDYGELGRILRNMELDGRNLTTLKAYARRTGYLHPTQAALGEVAATNHAEHQLNGGYGA